MVNYIEHEAGIAKLAQLLLEERLIPIFGAGFSKGSQALQGNVPDGNECTKIMKELIQKYVTAIDANVVEGYNFNEAAKRFKKSVKNYIPEREYLKFFKNNFTEVNLPQIKKDFLRLPWPYAFTINVDDGIENTGFFNPILPYQNAREHLKEKSGRCSLFKLHGDAKYELNYSPENNIIFDSDQYTYSLNEASNQTMRDCFSTAYKEGNLLFIGCSLKNEPDIKYIYNSISKERLRTMGILLRKNKLSSLEEEDLEEYGITDIILVKDYDLFYLDLFNTVSEMQNQNKANNYPFTNPRIELVEDKDLKYFSGFRCFDEKNNTFFKSNLVIDRDYLSEIEDSFDKYNVIFVEGRRFCGKTSLLCTLCEKEKRRTIYFFPSTTQERADMIGEIVENHKHSLLIFDSNSLSTESYYLIRDISDRLTENDNKIIIAANQSDNYLPELLESDYIKIKNNFSEEEIKALIPKTDQHALTKRKIINTNLDYLNIIKKEQGISLSINLNLPKEYTKAEQIWVCQVFCNGVQREHNKKLNNGLPILHKVPPK